MQIKFHILSRFHVTSAIVMFRKQKQASFRAKKNINFFIHAKCPNQATTRAKALHDVFFIFLFLSFMSAYRKLRIRGFADLIVIG